MEEMIEGDDHEEWRVALTRECVRRLNRGESLKEIASGVGLPKMFVSLLLIQAVELGLNRAEQGEAEGGGPCG